MSSLRPDTSRTDDLEERRVLAAVLAGLVGDEAPVRIGRFIVLRRIGAGGMGVVYAARDEQLDRNVAVKLLPPGVANTAEASARMQREGQAMARLSHPNVVQVYEVGTFESQVFVAMELLEGETLRAWLAQPRRWSDVVDTFLQAGRGLAAAHAAGVVHRDFKPENVMIGAGTARPGLDARVCVLDFGLARPDSSTTIRTLGDAGPADSATLTQTGAILGTPAYMAPEQLAGDEVDARSDQFSFCVAFWEALYGTRPFAGSDVSGLAAAVREGRIAKPPGDRKVPAWLRRAIERGLQADPAARWPTMVELLTHVSQRRHRRWRPWLVPGVGLCLVAAAAVALQSRADPPSSRSLLAEVWDESRRSTVRSSIAAASSDAAATWAGVESRIDDMGERWIAMRDRDCAEGTEHVARCECLAAWLERLNWSLAVVTEPDASIIDGLASVLAPLGDPGTCEAEPDQLVLAQRPWPPDASLAHEVFRERMALARAQADNERGVDWDELLTRHRELAERARTIGFAPLHAEALLALVPLELDAGGNVPRATALLDETVLTAQRAGDPVTAAHAAALATWTHAAARRLDRAHAMRPTAEALVAQAPTFDARVWLLQADGRIAAAEGRWDESIAKYEACIAEGVELASATLHVSRCRRDIATPLLRAGRGDEAVRHGEAAVRDREAVVGPGHLHTANALQQLALTLLTLDRGDEAAAAAARATEIRRAQTGVTTRTVEIAGMMIAGHALAGRFPVGQRDTAWLGASEPAAIARAMNRLWPVGHVTVARELAARAREVLPRDHAMLPVARELVLLGHYAPDGDDALRWLESLCDEVATSGRTPLPTQCLDVHVFAAFRSAARGDVERVRSDTLRASGFVREHLRDAERWQAVVGFRRAEALSRAGSTQEAAAAARDAMVLARDVLNDWDLVEARYVAGSCFLAAGDVRQALALLEPARTQLEQCCPRSLLWPAVAFALARTMFALADDDDARAQAIALAVRAREQNSAFGPAMREPTAAIDRWLSAQRP